ncbi:MAG: hypothetical protein K0S65_5865 [Labilithrix sp.]|nr:hypothetical protein [Labilithrix sp.]
MKKPGLIAAIFALAACADTGNIEGSGRLVEVQRDVAAFHAVEVSDGLRVEVAVGPQSVALHLDDNILDHVRIEVRGGLLVLEADSDNMGFEPSSGAVIRVASPTIDAVTVLDGGRARAETRSREVVAMSKDGGRLELVAHDAQLVRATAHDGSKVVLSGSAVELNVGSSDGSNVESTMPCESVIVDTHDGSDVRARASKSVRVEASDGSKVHILGNPGSRDVTTSDGSSVNFSE